MNGAEHLVELAVDEELLGIADFWRGRTVADLALEKMSAEQIQGSTHEGRGDRTASDGTMPSSFWRANVASRV